jgi:hypothetical protein
MKARTAHNQTTEREYSVARNDSDGAASDETVSGKAFSRQALAARAFRNGDADFCDASALTIAIPKRNRAAVGFDDLPGQRQPYARTRLLRRVERDKKIVRIGEAGAVVFNLNGNEVTVFHGAERYFGLAGFEDFFDLRVFSGAGGRGFHGVAYKIDKELLDLVGIGKQIDVRRREETDVNADFEADDAFEERLQRYALEDGRGELRELAVGLDESVEGVGAVLDNAEAAAQVAL